MYFSSQSSQSTKPLNFDFDDQTLSNNIIISLSTILLDCIQTIEILNRRTYKPVNLDKWKYKPLCQRFKIPKEFTLEEDEIGAGDAFCYENMKKIHYVSDFFCTILQETRCELYYNCQFTILKSLVTDLEDTKEDEYIMLQNEQEENNKILKAEINILGDKIKYIMKNKFSLIHNLLAEHEQVKFECQIKENYLLNWENSIKEQCLLKQEISKNNLEKQINETLANIDAELNVHMSITSYIWQNISDKKREIDLLQKKFDLNHETMHNQILSTKDKRDEIQELLAKKKEEYQSRQEQIEEYLMTKARRKEEIVAEQKKKKEKKLQVFILEANKTLQKSKKSKSGKKSRKKA